jgi:hypothetical protein
MTTSLNPSLQATASHRGPSASFVDDTFFAVEAPTITETVQMLTELAPAACEWRCTHACCYNVAKFNLVHLTCNESQYFPAPLTFDDTVIHPSETAKYLGLIVDRKLRWKPQVAAAIAKGTKALLGIAHLARPTFSLPQKYVHQLVIGVAFSRMEYGLPVFYDPIRQSTTHWRLHGAIGTA